MVMLRTWSVLKEVCEWKEPVGKSQILKVPLILPLARWLELLAPFFTRFQNNLLRVNTFDTF